MNGQTEQIDRQINLLDNSIIELRKKEKIIHFVSNENKFFEQMNQNVK